VNAVVALLVALVVAGSFSICLSPVIAKFSAFTLLQSDWAATTSTQFVTAFVARSVGCQLFKLQKQRRLSCRRCHELPVYLDAAAVLTKRPGEEL